MKRLFRGGVSRHRVGAVGGKKVTEMTGVEGAKTKRKSGIGAQRLPQTRGPHSSEKSHTKNPSRVTCHSPATDCRSTADGCVFCARKASAPHVRSDVLRQVNDESIADTINAFDGSLNLKSNMQQMNYPQLLSRRRMIEQASHRFRIF